MKNYGWKGTFTEFIHADKDDIVHNLCLQIYGQTLQEARHTPIEQSVHPQLKSWYDCIEYLMEEVPHFQQLPGFLIFEYELPRSGRKRPDILLFLPGEVLVLEFKRYSDVKEPEYLQTSYYIRDLQSYHSAVQAFGLKVRGALVLTSEDTLLNSMSAYQIYVLGRESLRKLVKGIENKSKKTQIISDQDFLNGAFQPLPSIIESAKSIMRDEPLPQIKTLKSSNYDHVVAEVKSIVEAAKHHQTHHLVLVSGVPGAGKTFVGLTLAHELEKAIYLSGNGPLVDVLQDSLQNKTFVQPLLEYKSDYIDHGRIPEEHVMIFDEAQRAWDEKKMKINKSEPDIFIEMAQHKEWSVVIGLIGEGQEIHTGEESGIGLWNKAIQNKGFMVHARHHQSIFPNALQYHENPELHLKTSLRTHNALMYFEWVESIISGDFKRAEELQENLKKERYTVKWVNDLDSAKDFVRKVYEGTDQTYGIVMSSGAKPPIGVKTIPKSGRYANPKNHVAYFNYPESPYYCRNLEYAATEFQIQGLELDMAIVYWGKDLQWTNSGWKISNRRAGAKDPDKMKLNIYRVLLTRGRDGVIICSE
ncbi:DNA/RNA helicase domain-containing protein [Oceanobacillus jeddahense]|uniref:DUF2075 domain-containing protein n=1 Tax=Oceanobacillus jeddahense TaxID=1462527 RepID=A0ABY5JRU0_9BACI|nr:DNA/RNA helicase domain-containing protein [Oceanobacillus jeddahense]UUI03043.1 DUF2075 domain-containing protein [Oceanobacillus jeddahense]